MLLKLALMALDSQTGHRRICDKKLDGVPYSRKWLSVTAFCCVFLCGTSQETVQSTQEPNWPLTAENFFHSIQSPPTDNADPRSNKFMLLQLLLTKASNEENNDFRKPEFDERLRFFRSQPSIGTDTMARYFQYRYDQGDRWTLARVLHPAGINIGQGLTRAPLPPARRPDGHPAGLSPTTPSPSPALIPFFSGASILLQSKPASSKPALITSGCPELPHRFSIGICGNRTAVG